MIRTSHTLAELELSPAAYEEIATKLLDAGYNHAFLAGEGGMIDMSGFGITRADPRDWRCINCKSVCSNRATPPERCEECGYHIFAKIDVVQSAPRICTVCHTPEGLPHRYRHTPKYAEVV